VLVLSDKQLDRLSKRSMFWSAWFRLSLRWHAPERDLSP
jgi:hypothetical protein